MIITLVSFLFCFLVFVTFYLRVKRGQNRGSIGIFHPYCNAGGGGERVLWVLVRLIQKVHPTRRIAIYTGDKDVTDEQMIQKVEKTFKIRLNPATLSFVHLKGRWLVDGSTYPVITLLGQALGSVILSLEAIYKFTPDIYMDTMGYAFSYPVFKLCAGCPTMSYVHYPIVSTDMLHAVETSTGAAFNNRSIFANNPRLRNLKVKYYQIFAWIYGQVGRMSDVVMVNSSWTKGHIDQLWKIPDRTHLVFPPCDTRAFQSLPSQGRDSQFRKHTILSVAQFRPEKNHRLQIEAFKTFLDAFEVGHERRSSQLILVGSCRNEEDQSRVEDLKQLAVQLGVQDQVSFQLNISFEELLHLVEKANVGLHSMENEHFGIGIVELMAGGLIVIAHNSGGPKMDIIKPSKTGFLASTREEYAQVMKAIGSMEPDALMQMIEKAKEDVKRFSDQMFEQRSLLLLRQFIR